MAPRGWLYFALGLGSAAIAAPVTVEFTGVDASADPVRVSLVDPATKERDWVKLGGRFAGCEVRAYDAKKQTLRLVRGGETWEVALQAGLIATTASLNEEERAEIQKAVRNNLRQLAAAADQYYLENGVATAKLELLVGNGPNHYIKELKPVDGEDYSKLEFRQAMEDKWVVVTGRGVEVRYQQP
jgi:hypothetical protein